MISTIEIIDAVHVGANLLDEEMPGWWNRVNIDTLDMRDANGNCIGAQLGWPDGVTNSACTGIPQLEIAFCWRGDAFHQADTIQIFWENAIADRRRKDRVKELINKFKGLLPWT